jgi:hypothetical protein
MSPGRTEARKVEARRDCAFTDRFQLGCAFELMCTSAFWRIFVPSRLSVFAFSHKTRCRIAAQNASNSGFGLNPEARASFVPPAAVLHRLSTSERKRIKISSRTDGLVGRAGPPLFITAAQTLTWRRCAARVHAAGETTRAEPQPVSTRTFHQIPLLAYVIALPLNRQPNLITDPDRPSPFFSPSP